MVRVLLEIWRKARHYLFSFPVILAEVAMFCNKTEMKIKEPHTLKKLKHTLPGARPTCCPAPRGVTRIVISSRCQLRPKCETVSPWIFLSLHSCSVCPLCPVCPCPVLLTIDVAVLHGTTTLWKFRLDKLKIYKGTLPPEACGWENSAA